LWREWRSSRYCCRRLWDLWRWDKLLGNSFWK
jgi:hypothetical protein